MAAKLLVIRSVWWFSAILFLPLLLFADETSIYNYSFSKEETTASSVLIEDGKPAKLYAPANVSDGSAATAWCSGAAKGGIGEWIRFRSGKKHLFSLRGIALSNGYTASKMQYFANNRIKEIEVILTSVSGREEKFKKKMADVFPTEEKMHPQLGVAHHIIEFPACEKKCTAEEEDGGGRRVNIESIRLKILSVYPGKKHNDTCISEVQRID